MNDAPRQTLRALIARHGPGLCSDARRCEALLRDHAGAHRREVNILVSALKERVPLDLLAAQSAMPRGLLVARLTKRLEDQLGLTAEAARWAVDSWALALGVVTEAEVREREEQEKRAGEQKPAPPSSIDSSRPAFGKEADDETGRAAQTQTARTPPPPASPPPPPRQQQQQRTQPPARATTPTPKPSAPPPTVARPASRQPPPLTSPPPAPKTSWPPPPWGRTWFPVRRQSGAAPRAGANAPTTGALPFPVQDPAQEPARGGGRRTLRGCAVGCLLIVLLTLALVVGGPFVLSVLREEQERRNLEPSPVLSP